MKICSAAAEVWFESEEIGFGAIGGPWLVIETALNLIRLLVILVRPHVVGEGARQAVVGDAFEAVAELRSAHDGERDFEREHRFDYRAEFSPLRGVASGEVLVGGEDAVGQAVIAIELCELMQECLAVFVFPADEGPYGGSLEAHGIVDAVRGERGVAKALMLVEFVEPKHAQDFIVPAELTPVAQGTRRQLCELIREVTLQDWNHARVACCLLILGEGFEHDHARPPVVIRVRADHAVGLLVVECPIDELLRFGFEARIVEWPGERDESVKEIGAALPGFASAAEPARVRADVSPGFIEMTAETAGLNWQLRAQPACRAD